MSTSAWLDGLFASIDRRDAAGFAAQLTEDVRFQFGNWPPVHGRQQTQEMVAAFFQSIKAINHQLLESWIVDNVLICRGIVTYTRHDSTVLAVPFANILKLRQGLAGEYLVYVDASALTRES